MTVDPRGVEALDTAENSSNNQGVYIYQPAGAGKPHGERPSKRRKVQQESKEPERDPCPFVPLLNGEESKKSVQTRYQTYAQLWSDQESKIQGILDDVDAEVLKNVASFVRSSSPQIYGGCIPTALVTVGSNVSSLGRLLGRLNDQLTTASEGGVVILESGDAPNLKTTLKNIIRAAITNIEGNDRYQHFLADREGPRLLGYDLDLLGDYVMRNDVKHLVLAFRDSEAFDPGILVDLFSLLSAWADRIPFTLLFGISTSVELFESRLPRSSAALLRGRYFEIHEASNCVDRIYERLQAESDGRFWLGRNITSILFEKSSDYFQTPEAFGRTVQYAYMSHFFANPISVLLTDDTTEELQQKKLCEAIRNLPSFREHCESLIQSGINAGIRVRSMVEDDSYLFQQALQLVESGQQSMRDMFQAVKLTHLLLTDLHITKKASISELSIRALSGELQDSNLVQDILRAFKQLDSTKLQGLISSLPDRMLNQSEFVEVEKAFKNLIRTHNDPEPLRSEYDSRNSLVETTVVQKRVSLSKGKAKLSEESIKYTKIIDRFSSLLDTYFRETLLVPQDLPLHEVFLSDMRNPLKEVFAPRPRFAIERALSNPFDYLVSASQKEEGSRVSSKQPATAILYQLYLESGALVNIHDLWQAFFAVFQSEQGESCDERMTMSLFYRALSELKALGVLKTSRKKVDHAAKAAWVGL